MLHMAVRPGGGLARALPMQRSIIEGGYELTEPQQPQWSPPPQQPAGWGAGGAAPAERPVGTTLAAIYLIVMGVLFGLFGACVGLIGGTFAGVDVGTGDGGNPFAALGVGVALFGIIVLVVGILSIVAGAGIMSRKGWARWTGVVVAVVLAVIAALIGVAALDGSAGGGTFFLVVAVLYALSAYALFAARQYFDYAR